MGEWWQKYLHHYYWRRERDKKYCAYLTTQYSPFIGDDLLTDEVIKIIAFAVHEDVRGQRVGAYLMDGICSMADRTGCSIYLVSSSFDIKFRDDPIEMLDCLDSWGCGFSEIYNREEVRKKSRRLQHWYIDKFDFRRCKLDKHQVVFQNKYLEKKGQLLRISENAKPEVREKLNQYCR